jgi:hypothetical protein
VWVSAALARPVGGVGTPQTTCRSYVISEGKVHVVATNVRVTEAVSVW